MSIQKAAADLIKIADELDKQAELVTSFVCDKCNHTATLATINGTRKAAGLEVGEHVVVSPVTVNDKVACPACDGVLSYSQTEESNAYYFEAKDEEACDDKKEEEEDKTAKSPSKEEIAEEAKETPEEQAREEAGEKLHEESHKASVNYDQVERYTRG